MLGVRLPVPGVSPILICDKGFQLLTYDCASKRGPRRAVVEAIAITGRRPAPLGVYSAARPSER